MPVNLFARMKSFVLAENDFTIHEICFWLLLGALVLIGVTSVPLQAFVDTK